MNGAVVIVQLTPFKEDGFVDYEALKQNTSFLVEKKDYGPMVLVPTGSTGEFYAMNDEERKKVVKTVVDVAGGKIPVIAGTGQAGTMPTIEFSKYAKDVGVDGVMIILPYYHVAEEEGMYLHYKEIAEKVDIEIMLYNNPDTSKVYIKPNLMKRIVNDIPKIVAVKENTPYVFTLYQHIRNVGDKVAILQGRGEWWYAATAMLGVRGYISGYANFMPERCLDLLKAGLSKDYTKVKEFMDFIYNLDGFIVRMAEKYGPSTTILPYPYVNSYMAFPVMKAAMDILGLTGGKMRLPILNLKDEDRKELENILFDEMGLQKIG
jgi:4-hydroxy-tetrahydrodipicolinate synthase